MGDSPVLVFPLTKYCGELLINAAVTLRVIFADHRKACWMPNKGI
jgi:hypothetical protein